jgi:hypothetical protein
LKTDAKEIPVIACGGASFLLPKTIGGASNVIFPEHLEVANAFGACIAQISSEDELIVNTLQCDEAQELERLLTKVKNKLLKNGASEDSINILAKIIDPLSIFTRSSKAKS